MSLETNILKLGETLITDNAVYTRRIFEHVSEIIPRIKFSRSWIVRSISFWLLETAVFVINPSNKEFLETFLFTLPPTEHDAHNALCFKKLFSFHDNCKPLLYSNE